MEWQHRRCLEYPNLRVSEHFRSLTEARISPSARALVVRSSEYFPNQLPSQHHPGRVAHCQADRSRHQPVYELATTILLLHISLRH